MALVSVDPVRPHVRLVTLDNPSRLNSMSFALVTDLYAALEEVAADNSCRVVVLTGAGRAFCSGLELEHAGLPRAPRTSAATGWACGPWSTWAASSRPCGRSPSPSWPPSRAPPTAAACASPSAPTSAWPAGRPCSAGPASATG